MLYKTYRGHIKPSVQQNIFPDSDLSLVVILSLSSAGSSFDPSGLVFVLIHIVR